MDGASIASSASTVTHQPVQGSSKDLRPGLDTSILKQHASRSLTDVLDGLSGPKILIIDPAIAGPLGLVIEVSELKGHGVDKLFWLEPGPLGNAANQVRNVVWVCRQSIQAMKIVAGERSSFFSLLCTSLRTQLARASSLHRVVHRGTGSVVCPNIHLSMRGTSPPRQSTYELCFQICHHTYSKPLSLSPLAACACNDGSRSQTHAVLVEQVLSASAAAATNPTTPGSAQKTFTLLLSPRLSHLCSAFLSDAGVLGSLDVRPFEMGFIPLERDLLSLEEDWAGYDKIFKVSHACQVAQLGPRLSTSMTASSQDGDYGPVYDMASSLMMLQRAFGLITRLIGKGDSAKVAVRSHLIGWL